MLWNRSDWRVERKALNGWLETGIVIAVITILLCLGGLWLAEILRDLEFPRIR